MHIRLHPALAFVATWVVFLLAMGVATGIRRLAGLEGEFLSGVCFKFVLAALALLLMLLDRRRLGEFGFCRSRSSWPDWLIGLALGGLFGAVGSAAIIVSPAKGMTFIQQQAFWQIIVGVWIVSSISEEILVRGLAQSWMTGGGGLRLGRVRLSTAVLTSGLLFGSMHLMILRAGVDAWTVCIVVAFTTSLGLVAAHYREKSGSLLLPIVIHAAGNVGGMVGGVITAILTMILTGSPPNVAG